MVSNDVNGCLNNKEYLVVTTQLLLVIDVMRDLSVQYLSQDLVKGCQNLLEIHKLVSKLFTYNLFTFKKADKTECLNFKHFVQI